MDTDGLLCLRCGCVIVCVQVENKLCHMYITKEVFFLQKNYACTKLRQNEREIEEVQNGTTHWKIE